MLKLIGLGAIAALIGPAAFGRLCVETSQCLEIVGRVAPAAFGRLCVETCTQYAPKDLQSFQPPSGGCVLKPSVIGVWFNSRAPAAFGRLCVETNTLQIAAEPSYPAAFGRLCVETMLRGEQYRAIATSRLRAAVC